eukprot:6633798-Karenia_brevis.AAC.1
MSKHSHARGGAEGTASEDGELPPQVAQYINSVWHGAHPPSSMNARSVKEMRLISECLDDLLRGNLSQCGDRLMQ